MKKSLFAVAFAAVVMFLVGCDKESYRHQTGLIYPAAGNYGIAYADQTIDTVIFATFDSYNASSNVSWITVDPEWASMKIENNYWAGYQIPLPLTFSPNTSGESRMGEVKIHTFGEDDWDYTITATYIQAGWHDVYRPTPSYAQYTDFPTSASFELKDSANWVVDSLKFMAFNDWTLVESAGSFAHPIQSTGSKGEQVVILNLDPNETSNDRSTTLVLKSDNGVSTEIKVTQYADK